MKSACKICGGRAEPFHDAVVLQRHAVRFARCVECEFVQTQEPHWLAEAYREPINATDTGYVTRNLECARTTQAVIALLGKSDGDFVDYGGGYGLFVRLMRDRGLQFYLQDKYCPNHFARGFAADAEGARRYALLTAFEVFEHLPQPREELEQMLAFSDTILFSTELAPPDPAAFARWDYTGLEHGQHVAFYTFRTLQKLAADFGLHLCSNFWNLHLLSRTKVSARLFRWVVSPRIARLIAACARRPSLREADYRAMKTRLLSAEQRIAPDAQP